MSNNSNLSTSSDNNNDSQSIVPDLVSVAGMTDKQLDKFVEDNPNVSICVSGTVGCDGDIDMETAEVNGYRCPKCDQPMP